ncbi:hypothetical protein CCR75_002306 [Bremia lactucae]|uniref:Uncharacterized protein n=1 Tax=Bremia lactucae TaxID=4779 RepID=A0A976IC45_BRELC|nr:hypothetical protein CCR75_002306 [Bremia lactucae]
MDYGHCLMICLHVRKKSKYCRPTRLWYANLKHHYSVKHACTVLDIQYDSVGQCSNKPSELTTQTAEGAANLARKVPSAEPFCDIKVHEANRNDDIIELLTANYVSCHGREETIVCTTRTAEPTALQ